MSDTSYPTKIKFPEIWKFSREDFPRMYGVFQVYGKQETEEWFKQCIEDFPDFSKEADLGLHQYIVGDWFEKWFNQFNDTSPTSKNEE